MSFSPRGSEALLRPRSLGRERRPCEGVSSIQFCLRAAMSKRPWSSCKKQGSAATDAELGLACTCATTIQALLACATSERPPRDQRVAGSRPVTPTNLLKGLGRVCKGVEPDQDGSDVEHGEVVGGPLLVAGRDAAE